MKILIISGFLGAGKTTFIKELCKKTGRDFCVFENEYAQTDIDKALLMQNGNLDVWELTENCICCSGKQDFASSILTISNTIDPEYLIVEPTGVAKLSAVIENIKQIQYERISLLQPLVIIDGTTIHSLPKAVASIFEDQVTNAGKVLISKMESADEQSLASVSDAIYKIAPDALIVREHYSSLDNDWWQSLLATDITGEIQVVSSASDDESSMDHFSLVDVSLPTPVHLISFLEMITFGIYGSIFRAKGFLPCGKNLWLQFDVVNGIYQITEIEKQEQARVVFIGLDILRSDLRKIFMHDVSRIDTKRPYRILEKTGIGRS
ncbi:MAG: GTP-binding protein [Treponema sp.]|nr:GTP-binding protein [Treponema sp.]